MKKLTTSIIILVTTLILSSCGSINESRKVAGISKQKLFLDGSGEIQPTLFWAHYDATQRGSMLYVGRDKKVRVLAENPPDAAIQSIVKIGAELKGVKGIEDAELAFETQRNIAELGKRTAAVNMLRDALYRLNELYYANQDAEEALRNKLLDKDFLVFQKYHKTLDSITNSSKISFSDLFTKVIESAKEISTNESTASQVLAKAESKASIAKSEALKLKVKLLQDIYDKIKETTDEEEAKKIFNKIINLK